MWNELNDQNPSLPKSISTELGQVSEEHSVENQQMSLLPPQPQIQKDDNAIVVPSLSFDGYQVVRQEFFAHMREPSLTFNSNRVYVNSYCLARLPQVVYTKGYWCVFHHNRCYVHPWPDLPPVN